MGLKNIFHQRRDNLLAFNNKLWLIVLRYWIDGRVVEGARLEIVCTPKGYRGFESLSIRHLQKNTPCGCFFVNDEERRIWTPEEGGSLRILQKSVNNLLPYEP